MAEKNYGDNSQLSEIIKYISDTIRFPVLGVGGGFAPIGTINAYMGTVAPIGYLVCDGQTYNISDYPDLATHIASHFGSTNFFGGNGTTTFAVPDLRGEFLRGSGTNSHENQGSGEDVGEHQDATDFPFYSENSSNAYLYLSYSPLDVEEASTSNKYDSYKDIEDKLRYTSGTNGTDKTRSQSSYTSRPTNTSVLYIIKATLSDAEIAAYHIYTPREHQVGWWQEMQNGVLKQKPVYEKTINTITSATTSTDKTISIGDGISVDKCIEIKGIFEQTTSSNKYAYPFFMTDNSMASYIKVYLKNNNIGMRVTLESWLNTPISITIQYTKTTDEWQTI